MFNLCRCLTSLCLCYFMYGFAQVNRYQSTVIVHDFYSISLMQTSIRRTYATIGNTYGCLYGIISTGEYLTTKCLKSGRTPNPLLRLKRNRCCLNSTLSKCLLIRSFSSWVLSTRYLIPSIKHYSVMKGLQRDIQSSTQCHWFPLNVLHQPN